MLVRIDVMFSSNVLSGCVFDCAGSARRSGELQRSLQRPRHLPDPGSRRQTVPVLQESDPALQTGTGDYQQSVSVCSAKRFGFYCRSCYEKQKSL